jgi:hypothetical protein
MPSSNSCPGRPFLYKITSSFISDPLSLLRKKMPVEWQIRIKYLYNPQWEILCRNVGKNLLGSLFLMYLTSEENKRSKYNYEIMRQKDLICHLNMERRMDCGFILVCIFIALLVLSNAWCV